MSAIDTISDRLYEYLRDNRITQEHFAEVVDVDQTTVSRWITRAQTPSVDMLVRICDATGMTADYLLGLEDDYG